MFELSQVCSSSPSTHYIMRSSGWPVNTIGSARGQRRPAKPSFQKYHEKASMAGSVCFLAMIVASWDIRSSSMFQCSLELVLAIRRSLEDVACSG